MCHIRIPILFQEMRLSEGNWNRTACMIRELLHSAPQGWEILQLLSNNNQTVMSALKESHRSYIPWSLKHWGAMAYVINRAGQRKLMEKFHQGGHQYLGTIPSPFARSGT